MEPDDAEQGMFAFFRFKALDRPLDALEALIELGRNLAEKGRRLELRLLYHIYMDEMLKIRLRALSDTEAERYFALCHDAFQLSLCVSVECGRLITVLFRGRGLARLHGNRVQAHLHALLIGAANCLEHSRHNTMRFHAMMEHALTVLQQSEEYLLQGYPLPVGIYFFMQGKFRRAIDTLLPESRSIFLAGRKRTPEHTVTFWPVWRPSFWEKATRPLKPGGRRCATCPIPDIPA